MPIISLPYDNSWITVIKPKYFDLSPHCF